MHERHWRRGIMAASHCTLLYRQNQAHLLRNISRLAHAQRSVVGLECRGHFVLPEITRIQASALCANNHCMLAIATQYGQCREHVPPVKCNRLLQKAAPSTAVSPPLPSVNPGAILWNAQNDQSYEKASTNPTLCY